MEQDKILLTNLPIIHILSVMGSVVVFWTLQLVVYPLYANIEPSKFASLFNSNIFFLIGLVWVLLLVDTSTVIKLLFNITDVDFHKYVRQSFILLLGELSVFLFMQLPLFYLLKNNYNQDQLRLLINFNYFILFFATLRIPSIFRMINHFQYMSQNTGKSDLT